MSPTWHERWLQLEAKATQAWEDRRNTNQAVRRSVSMEELWWPTAEYEKVAFLRNTAAEVAEKEKAAERLYDAVSNVCGVQHEDCSNPPCTGCYLDTAVEKYEQAKDALDRRVKELQGD